MNYLNIVLNIYCFNLNHIHKDIFFFNILKENISLVSPINWFIDMQVHLFSVLFGVYMD